jgi:hypothetical protein
MLNIFKNIKKNYRQFLIEEGVKYQTMPKFEVDAVYEEDLEIFLNSIGILDSLNDGYLKCEFCNETVTLENLISVYPYKEEIKLCCNKPNCYHSLIKRGI